MFIRQLKKMNTKIQMITIIVSVLILNASGHRQTDSILDIMNPRHIERMMAERRMNASRDEKRFLIQNDLDDDFSETENPDNYQTPEIAVDFEYNGRKPTISTRPVDILMQYNDTIIPTYQQSPGPDILADLQAFRADKLLKSSKNALIVTKKEYLKKDWCKTEPLVQRIREDGCLSRTIINRFCYGQCNSFYIPKSPRRRGSGGPGGGGGKGASNRLRDGEDFEDEDLTGAAFRSCAFCKPKKFTWITVTLRCPSLMPQLRKKRIQRIKQCKCLAEPLN